MGAITKIRQISPYFLAAVAVLFIAFMVIQDSSCDTVRRSQQSPENIAVAEVNGEKLSLADYERRVRDIIDRQRAQNPGQEIDDTQIRQQIFDEMINEILRRQEAEKMGLTVTKQEIIDVMLINPPAELQFFKDSTGRFQKEMYQDLVSNPDKLGEMLAAQQAPPEEVERQVAEWRKTLLQIEDGVRIQKLEEALRAASGAAASIVSPAYAAWDYKTNNGTADVKYIAIPADRIGDKDATPTDAELMAYYEANKQYYEQKRSRRLKYLVFQQVPSDKDTARAEKRSQKLLETFSRLTDIAAKDSAFTAEMMAMNGESKDFTPIAEIEPQTSTILASMQQGDVFGPLTTPTGIMYYRLDGRRDGTNPVVKASHILISFDADKEAAKMTAMDVMAKAKKGDDFAALAMQYSKDPGSAQQGGDLGFFGKGRMVKPFEEAAFGANVGDVVGPIETQFGWHIIKVTDKQSTELKWSQIAIRTVMSTATKQTILANAAKAAKQIEEGMPIDDVAKQYNLKATESPFFTSQTPILSSAEITAWAFESEKGAVIRKDIQYYGIVVAQVSDTRESGIKPFEDVKEQITRIVSQKKKMDKLKDLAGQIASACKGAGSLDAVRGIDSTLEIRIMTGCRNNGQLQGFGGEYTATQAAFTQPIGQISDAIRGQKAWFVMQVDNRAEANMADFEKNKSAVVQNLATRSRGSAYYSWFQKVREHADIKDKRNSRD